MRWRQAMRQALYGPDGFFVRHRPADHFHTSAQSPLFAQALARLVGQVDAALGSPARLDLVDVGAGRGELLTGILAALPPPLRHRVHPVAVEVLPAETPDLTWRDDIPPDITGLLLATEWLDNVPLDLALDRRYLDADGAPGEPIDADDAAWLDTWWPRGTGPVEIGRARDEAWAAAVSRVRRGLALAVDYGHLREARPALGTVTGFAGGREVPFALDGSTDITCHVAMDSVAQAGRAAAGGVAYTLIRQREALRALGIDGARPPLALADTDPAGYVRVLAAASQAATLTDPHGLGAHWWLTQPVRLRFP